MLSDETFKCDVHYHGVCSTLVFSIYAIVVLQCTALLLPNNVISYVFGHKLHSAIFLDTVIDCRYTFGKPF